MLGLLKPDKLELLVKDVLYYKLYYCSLCRHLVKKHNRAHAFLNSYEGTLLAMLYNEMVVQDVESVKDRCTGIPLVKVASLPASHPAVELGALVSLLAFQFKFRDNVSDERGFWRQMGNRWLLSGVESALEDERDIFARFNLDREWIAEQHRELERMERELPRGDTTPHLMQWGKIFAYIMARPFKEKVAEDQFDRLGAFFSGLGRIINLLDSMGDLHADREGGTFNLILNSGAPVPEDESGLRQLFAQWSAKIEGERAALLELLPRLGLGGSLPLVSNILTRCLDKELQKVFELMVMKRVGKERPLFHCNDF